MIPSTPIQILAPKVGDTFRMTMYFVSKDERGYENSNSDVAHKGVRVHGRGPDTHQVVRRYFGGAQNGKSAGLSRVV